MAARAAIDSTGGEARLSDILAQTEALERTMRAACETDHARDLHRLRIAHALLLGVLDELTAASGRPPSIPPDADASLMVESALPTRAFQLGGGK